MEACKDPEWRLIIALARFSGLRVQSERPLMKWSDVDWKRRRVRVPSPKTEHHPGGAERIIPLFPELHPYLEAAKEAYGETSEFLLPTCRPKCQNMRTQFCRIIKRAGVTQWPRVFQNLRASRETELVSIVPIQVACKWIGNSVPIAAKHYLQTTDEHFELVLGKKTAAPEPIAQAAKSIPNPAQNPAHHLATRGHKESPSKSTEEKNARE